jgi:hypothetical protein
LHDWITVAGEPIKRAQLEWGRTPVATLEREDHVDK